MPTDDEGSAVGVDGDRAASAVKRTTVRIVKGGPIVIDGPVEIELDDGVWEVDDAVSGDGLKYDVVLDQSFAVIAREEDGRDLSRKAP